MRGPARSRVLSTLVPFVLLTTFYKLTSLRSSNSLELPGPIGSILHDSRLYTCWHMRPSCPKPLSLALGWRERETKTKRTFQPANRFSCSCLGHPHYPSTL